MHRHVNRHRNDEIHGGENIVVCQGMFKAQFGQQEQPQNFCMMFEV
jgi:hypothetical protein